MKNKKYISLLIITISLVFFSACKRKFDLPPKASEPANSGSITIDSIYARFNAHYNCGVCYINGNPTKLYKFSTDITLTCTVTADEKSGNIYKTVYVRDATGFLQVKLLNGGGLSVGDLIRINLNGVLLDDYAKMVQLDSVDLEKKVVKINSGNVVTPIKTTYNQLTTQNPVFASVTSYSAICLMQGAVVTLDSVEFDVGSKNFPYADKVNLASIDRDLVTADSKFLIVRSSGYGNFANKIIPNGKGKITAVVSQYNGTIQLIIRDINEVQIADAPAPIYARNFEDQNLYTDNWTTYAVLGPNFWTLGTKGGNYANASNYNGSNTACESWLISPAFDLTATTNPALVFKTATAYPGVGSALQTYISTNYSVGSPTTAIWTPLSPTLATDPPRFGWVRSGFLSLSAYKTSNVRVAYKYTGTNTQGATWEVDNIGIVEN